MDAVSQNAFDTAAGQGTFISYAAYMTRETPITRYAAGIPAFNNLVRYSKPIVLPSHQLIRPTPELNGAPPLCLFFLQDKRHFSWAILIYM